MGRADADVIELGSHQRRSGPLTAVVNAASKPVAVVWPRPTVDEWGRDARLVEALSPLARIRWDVSVGGEHHLPDGGALIVINTRKFALTPISTAWALGRVLERPVRFVGRPDIVPFGPFLRRIGGLLARPEEIAGALRAGELVVLGAAPTQHPRHAGAVDHELLGAAVRENVPVHVGATLSTMIGRDARVEVTPALVPRQKRRGILAEVELADLAQQRLHELLDELGGTRTGVPGLDLLGEG
jgi:hypothetical protein